MTAEKSTSPGIHCLCYPSRNTSNTKKCNNLYLHKPAVTIGLQNLIFLFCRLFIFSHFCLTFILLSIISRFFAMLHFPLFSLSFIHRASSEPITHTHHTHTPQHTHTQPHTHTHTHTHTPHTHTHTHTPHTHTHTHTPEPRGGNLHKVCAAQETAIIKFCVTLYFSNLYICPKNTTTIRYFNNTKDL